MFPPLERHSFPAAIEHKGPFALGSYLKIKSYEVIIEAFIAEGGYAHVYSCIWGTVRLVLKRISCADTQALQQLVMEADYQKKLSGHENIVSFVEYSYGALQNGGFEMLLLMEHCGGGHLVDYLNSRLTNRLLEPEILAIFHQICRGVAHMHSQATPIAHRDLKIENVLLSNGVFKICDFGSCTVNVTPPNVNIPVAQCRKLEEEISKYTTLQYRAPEMCDLYQRLGLNEKVDIWALGVLLYKLCYYTTPFEESGKMAIMSARFTFPSFPNYSSNVKSLISFLLKANPAVRPDIFQVYKRVCELRGAEYDLAIKPSEYVEQTQAQKEIPTGSVFKQMHLNNAPVAVQTNEPAIPIMRRGRPSKTDANENHPADANNAGTQKSFQNLMEFAPVASNPMLNQPQFLNNQRNPQAQSFSNLGAQIPSGSNRNLNQTPVDTRRPLSMMGQNPIVYQSNGNFHQSNSMLSMGNNTNMAPMPNQGNIMSYGSQTNMMPRVNQSNVIPMQTSVQNGHHSKANSMVNQSGGAFFANQMNNGMQNNQTRTLPRQPSLQQNLNTRRSYNELNMGSQQMLDMSSNNGYQLPNNNNGYQMPPNSNIGFQVSPNSNIGYQASPTSINGFRKSRDQRESQTSTSDPFESMAKMQLHSLEQSLSNQQSQGLESADLPPPKPPRMRRPSSSK